VSFLAGHFGLINDLIQIKDVLLGELELHLKITNIPPFGRPRNEKTLEFCGKSLQKLFQKS